MDLRAGLRILALSLSMACLACWREEVTANQASELANEYLAEHLPQVPLNILRIETLDMGDRWRLSYNFPEGGTGGPMIFVVNKRTGEIVHMETEQ